MAVKHPYLMHGMLASSAMHLAHAQPSEAQKYLRLCDQHQTIAISQLREQLNRIDASNAAALFALAALLSVASLARLLPRVARLPKENTCDVLDWIVEIMTLTRGARDVLTLGYQWVQESPMRNALIGFDPPPHALAPAHVRAHMHRLSEFCIEGCTDAFDRDTCLEAIRYLRSTYDTACTLPLEALEIGHVMAWFVQPCPRFVDMLRERHPMAVLILYHHWVLWAGHRRSWLVQDLASLTLPFLEDLLDEKHQPWTEWPKTELANGMPCLDGTVRFFPAASMSTPSTSVRSPYTPG